MAITWKSDCPICKGAGAFVDCTGAQHKCFCIRRQEADRERWLDVLRYMAEKWWWRH